MNQEQKEWLAEYARLVQARRGDLLVEHVRKSVNLTKEVLLSTDPETQQAVASAIYWTGQTTQNRWWR